MGNEEKKNEKIKEKNEKDAEGGILLRAEALLFSFIPFISFAFRWR